MGKPLKQQPPTDFQPSDGGADDGRGIQGEECSG